MMLAAERVPGDPESHPLRVVLVTTHVPFRDVPRLLTTERVVRTGNTVVKRAPRAGGASSSRGWRCVP